MTAAALPLSVRLAGQRVVVVGGGPVAARKALRLSHEYGADLVIVAPEAVTELATAAGVTWHRRGYAGPSDLTGAVLVLAATDQPSLNARVVGDAAAAATLCIRVDAGGAGTADFPASVRRGQLTLAVSTDGAAPALARRLRDELADRYGPEYGELTRLLGDLRRDPAVSAMLGSRSEEQRRAAWRALPLADILALLRLGSFSSAREVASACLSSSSD